MAIIVGTALNLDMAVLVKQRVGGRPFRIFTNLGAARDWLESYRDSFRELDHGGSFPTGSRPHPRALRPN